MTSVTVEPRSPPSPGWESLEAITRFAGADYERAVLYPEDDRYLLERDDRVRHYDQQT
ncbi:hypothetical protein SAMN04487846_0817 [Microbacterium sp. cf046]|uniref:hypothetical protein n=1 Tax=Microbacterium sp. cf046 TaxID=1761803 RepID=UPI0008ED93E5|nr:hypothetical protein [Microbacterium sp. cf046]SFR93542.1 hypothetical protein SAMN04487846_0817 [Microbacterium sp. cf046]